MKKLVTIITFCILFSLCPDLVASDGTINSNSVNIRSSPVKKTKVLGKLNKGDKIEIISIKKNLVSINNYVGHWCKIKYKNTKGFILSCFISSEIIKDEPFHIFIKNLKSDIRINKFDESKFIFPIKSFYGEMGVNEIEKTKIHKKSFKIKMLSFMNSKHIYNTKIFIRNSKIEYYNTIEGDYSESYYFKLVNHKWKLVEIYISN